MSPYPSLIPTETTRKSRRSQKTRKRLLRSLRHQGSSSQVLPGTRHCPSLPPHRHSPSCLPFQPSSCPPQNRQERRSHSRLLWSLRIRPRICQSFMEKEHGLRGNWWSRTRLWRCASGVEIRSRKCSCKASSEENRADSDVEEREIEGWDDGEVEGFGKYGVGQVWHVGG